MRQQKFRLMVSFDWDVRASICPWLEIGSLHWSTQTRLRGGSEPVAVAWRGGAKRFHGDARWETSDAAVLEESGRVD